MQNEIQFSAAAQQKLAINQYQTLSCSTSDLDATCDMSSFVLDAIGSPKSGSKSAPNATLLYLLATYNDC
jgi:hypothetical protein